MQYKWLVGALALSSVVTAHSPFIVRRQEAPTNAADAAKVHGGPEKECKGQGDSTLTKMKSQFPDNWKIASIVDDDSEAKDLWKDIKKNVPKNVKVKPGQSDHMGIDQSYMQKYDKSDPDCWWSANGDNGCTKPKAKGIPDDLYKCPEPSTWGLTFDDGPNCSHNEFYDYLQKNKLRATLFYIGSNVQNQPYYAQRAIADGHDVCVHTWSHHYMTTLEDEQVFAELYYTGKIIKTVLGVTPRCWRPPFGDVDDRVRAIAAGLGLRTILWQEDTNDWKISDGKATKKQVEERYNNFINKANDESPIVLTHEISKDSMDVFMDMQPKVSKAYKNVVPLTACFNVTNPYPEDITYPDFKAFTDGELDPKGKPDISKVKVDAKAKYSVVPLSKQTESGTYMKPGKGEKKSSSKGGGGGSSSDDDGGSGGAASLKVSLTLFASTAVVAAIAFL